MGIYDRDYIRNQPPPPGYGPTRSPVQAMRMWSVTTWLIVICVAVFVIDGIMPRKPGLWQPVPVRKNVPRTVDARGGGPQYKIVPRTWVPRIEHTGALPGEPPPLGQPRGELAALAQPGTSLAFERVVYDISATPHTAVGTVTYQWMPPLTRWFHFSTDLAFRRLEIWRFVGFQFLHGNLAHLLFNMIALFFFGPLVERRLGAKRYLAFYLLCGIFGALMYLALNLGGFITALISGGSVAIPGLLFNSPATPLVGASAGIFGILMAGAFLAPNAIVLLFFFLPLRLQTLAYALVVLSLISIITGGPNAGGEAGHLGGAIAGWYFIRHPESLHAFFDFMGRIDPTSHHYRHGRPRGGGRAPAGRDQIDHILRKISSSGLHSLTEKEKRILRDASDRR